MNEQPKPIEYETPYKTVILSNPEQLVVKQGFKCINGGTAKVKGKFSPLFVRYDNKPELVAKITTWLEAWDKYNQWWADQVATAKSTMVTSGGNLRFDKAENADFSWTYWDGTSGKTLTEKATGRRIYQMRYSDSEGGSVTGEARIKASAFWEVLWALQEPPKSALTPEETDAYEKTMDRLPSQNDHPGWCNHCHSYCYGDCQS